MRQKITIQDHLEADTCEQIVTHFEKELELKDLEALDSYKSTL